MFATLDVFHMKSGNFPTGRNPLQKSPKNELTSPKSSQPNRFWCLNNWEVLRLLDIAWSQSCYIYIALKNLWLHQVKSCLIDRTSSQFRWHCFLILAAKNLLTTTLEFRHSNPQRLRVWPLSIHTLRRNVPSFYNYPQRVVANKEAKTRRIGPQRRSMFSNWVRSSHVSSIRDCNGDTTPASWENEISLDRGHNCWFLNYYCSSHNSHLHRQYSLRDSKALWPVACQKRGLRRV